MIIIDEKSQENYFNHFLYDAILRKSNLFISWNGLKRKEISFHQIILKKFTQMLGNEQQKQLPRTT